LAGLGFLFAAAGSFFALVGLLVLPLVLVLPVVAKHEQDAFHRNWRAAADNCLQQCVTRFLPAVGVL